MDNLKSILFSCSSPGEFLLPIQQRPHKRDDLLKDTSEGLAKTET